MKKSNLTLNIIGGKHKGKKIFLPPLSITRSSKSILRGSFFDSVQFDIVDKVFIECFAGSGSIGLEALSRGAKMAYFFELNKKSFDILTQNIKLLNEDQKAIAIFGDTFIELPKLLPKLEMLNSKLYFYFDPPFDFRDGMQGIYEKIIDLITKLPSSTELIAIEHLSSYKIPEIIGSFSLKKTKKFGKSSLSFYRIVE